MKKQTLKISIIILVLTFVLIGCSKDNNDSSDLTPTSVSESVVTPMATATDQPTATTQPTPEVSPEPTPTLEVLLELTKEQEQEIRGLVESYPYIRSQEVFMDNAYGRFIVAYYTYIGRSDKTLSVVAMTNKENAINTFGGEWDDISISDMEKSKCAAYGELTVSEIEQVWLSDLGIELFVTSVGGIDYTGIQCDYLPDDPLTDILKFVFCCGDIMIYEHDGEWHGDLSRPA